jgi:hypothetical protein
MWKRFWRWMRGDDEARRRKKRLQAARRREVSGYFGARTNFVWWRIQETRWADSEHIQELIRIEQAILWPGGAIRMAGVDLISLRYPVEARAIRLEVEDGIEITPEVLAGIPALLAREDEEREAQRRQAQREESRLLNEEYRQMRQEWLRRGGRP